MHAGKSFHPPLVLSYLLSELKPMEPLMEGWNAKRFLG
jgi:hypothetical protein